MAKNDQPLIQIFEDFFSALTKDLHKRGSFWTPTLVSQNADARTVVLRSFERTRYETQPRFYVHTDIRSVKWNQLLENPQASLHFYCTKRRWQMRIRSLTVLHTGSEFSQDQWDQLSDTSRKIYRLKNTPGTKVSDPEIAYDFHSRSEQSDDPGYKNFGVIELQAQHFESLELNRPDRGDFHVRAEWNTVSGDYSFLAP